MLKTFSSHDEPTKKIFSELNTKPFTQGKTPESLKGFMWNLTKHMLPVYAGSSVKGMLRPQSVLSDYQAKSERVEQFFHDKLMSSDKSFSDSVNESLDGFAELVKEIVGVLIAASIAKWRIERLFKGHDEAKNLIVCLAMNLPNNPVAEMGKLMLKLASYPEFIATSSAHEFQAKLIAGDYSDEFSHTYNDYIMRFGCRGVKEIDIATPRISVNLEHIYDTLKLINIEDNATTKTQQRSKDAYDKLLHLASMMGKGKKFEKLARTYRDMIGFRDHPKYMYVVAVGLLRQKALQLGKRWALSARIDKSDDIFHLSLNNISEGERNNEFKLIPIIERNKKALNEVSHVKDWPNLVDSRGKYYTYVPGAHICS